MNTCFHKFPCIRIVARGALFKEPRTITCGCYYMEWRFCIHVLMFKHKSKSLSMAYLDKSAVCQEMILTEIYLVDCVVMSGHWTNEAQ